MSVKILHHHISLNQEVCEDIQWWRHFLLQWNGVSIFPDSKWTHHSTMELSTMKLSTDASATIGYGAVFGQKWLYGVWPNELSGDLVSFQWKELFPIYTACFTWGPEWDGKRILFHTDNKTDVAIWTTQTTKSSDIMNMVQKLFLVTAKFDFEIKLVHIEGCLNSLADSLSRMQIDHFRDLFPDAKEESTILDLAVWDGLIPK